MRMGACQLHLRPALLLGQRRCLRRRAGPAGSHGRSVEIFSSPRMQYRTEAMDPGLRRWRRD